MVARCSREREDRAGARVSEREEKITLAAREGDGGRESERGRKREEEQVGQRARTVERSAREGRLRAPAQTRCLRRRVAAWMPAAPLASC